MGRVIRLDTEDGSEPAVLTETGTGGYLAGGYLRDRPASDYLDPVERPLFVLTNRTAGVVLERNDTTQRLDSGRGYRTIAVLTDRRVLVVVGDAQQSAVEGDQSLSLPLADVESVVADRGLREGTLTVRQSGAVAWHVQAGRSGIEAAAKYVEAASHSWRHVERLLDDAKRALVDAMDHSETGDYEAALSATGDAGDYLDDADRAVDAVGRERPVSSMRERVEQVRGRWRNTRAAVRIDRARAARVRGRGHWRHGEYEAAYDAYDSAHREFETARTLGAAHVENADRVETEHARVRQALETLGSAPMDAATEARRLAEAAEEPAATADALSVALERYRAALELDWGEEKQRFEGDPDEIRDHLRDTVERLTSARREAATKAKRAGEWYVGSEQYDLAMEAFERAREQYELGVAVARDLYPAAVDHLETELEALAHHVERAEAGREGEEQRPSPVPDDTADAEIPDGAGPTDASDRAADTDGEAPESEPGNPRQRQ